MTEPWILCVMGLSFVMAANAPRWVRRWRNRQIIKRRLRDLII